MSEEDHTKPTLRQLVSYLVMLGLFLVAVFAAAAFADYLRALRALRL